MHLCLAKPSHLIAWETLAVAAGFLCTKLSSEQSGHFREGSLLAPKETGSPTPTLWLCPKQACCGLLFNPWVRTDLPAPGVHILFDSRMGVCSRADGEVVWQRDCESCLYLNPVVIWLVLTFSWRRQWHPPPVLLPEKSRGRRSLVGCCPWGR